MTRPAILKAVSALILLCCCITMHSQKPVNPPEKTPEKVIEKKPYKVLNNGSKITIQGQENINNILVWTSAGHRVVEQKKLNIPSYSFDIPAKENIFFILIEMMNGKRFTEKVGVR